MVRNVVRSLAVVAALAGAASFATGCAPERHVSAAPTSLTPSATSTPTPTPTLSCAQAIVQRLAPAERAGQLIMVALDAGADPAGLVPLLAQHHVGGVVLLGGWDEGMPAVQAATTQLQPATAPDGIRLLIAADQEGGQIQQLRGEGFSDIPSGVEQGMLDPAALQDSARGWGGELANAGVNLNLAPIADTVPDALGSANPPIGGYDRQFSGDPAVAASHVSAFVRGMTQAGVATALKHFPGLGRVTGNTDDTDEGTTDSVTTTADLGPFEAGIRANVKVVMMSSAVYTQFDPADEAVFSRAVVTDLLRTRLGFDGVVISDDIGVAAAVSATPVEQRATRFIGAGGDIALTADPAAVAPFADSLVAAMAADPAFEAKVDAAVTRVVRLKVGMGLARCG
ncbi:glycoside hydrolase family 3 N-terminal domain-containing protein [Microbacterium rhizomatis]|uniref:beta-N-acetylhexosaminidase n=1 Tax=Microbacterium rhizomatis TaxID=1631477 RepID=A0A5J5J0K4_9MICO|nr:glycoside hydrolase family 3 N-terminal domain-containing protein [Microbacterium rhizomatis]KAA9107867.1 glycoside hydrolase family 3 protein [Microbacterium rhizomatis]